MSRLLRSFALSTIYYVPEALLGYPEFMNQNRKGNTRERVVCFCYNVPESVIVEAIRGGCHSLMDIRRETYASTGCAGCSEEVKKLLRKHVKADADANQGQQSDE